MTCANEELKQRKHESCNSAGAFKGLSFVGVHSVKEPARGGEKDSVLSRPRPTPALTRTTRCREGAERPSRLGCCLLHELLRRAARPARSTHAFSSGNIVFAEGM